MSKIWKKSNFPDIEKATSQINLTKISSLGSCFSRNIFNWLQYNQIIKYSNCWDVFYNPFSILAEFKRITEKEDLKMYHIYQTNDSFIDPWRTWLTSNSLEDLEVINIKFNETAIQQLLNSETIIITFGLTEVWRKNNIESLYTNCLSPKKIIENKTTKEYTCLIASQIEVYNAIDETIYLIKKYFPNINNIILSLSPIPLKYTFSNYSLREANNISKSSLLLAIRDVCKKNANTYYFPAFEFVQALSERNYDELWQIDDRHITASAIDFIANKFINFCNFKIEDKSNNDKFYVPAVNEKGNVIGRLYSNGKILRT